MATNKIKTFGEKLNDIYDADTFNNSGLRTNTGFVVGTNIQNTPMNTILRGATLFANAFLDVLTTTLNENNLLPSTNFTYDMGVQSATNYIKQALLYTVPKTAEKVGHRLLISINNGVKFFDGSRNVNLSFYAPTESGDGGSVLISQGFSQGAILPPKWERYLPVASGGTGKGSFNPNYLLCINENGEFQELDDGNEGALFRTSRVSLPGYGKLPLSYGGTHAVAKGALFKSDYDLPPEYGTLPVSMGGTGATTINGIKAKLGINYGSTRIIATYEQEKMELEINIPANMTSPKVVAYAYCSSGSSFYFCLVNYTINTQTNKISFFVRQLQISSVSVQQRNFYQHDIVTVDYVLFE